MQRNGLIEGIKRSVVTALRRSLSSKFREKSDVLSKVADNVTLEYPLREVDYPGIWVQFSLTEIRRGSITPEIYGEDKDGNLLKAMEGFYKGSVTLAVVAMTNTERDRISDSLFDLLLFGDISRDNAEFFESLSEDEYIRITPNKDRITPRGQSTNIGAPWDPNALVYEDGYSFNILGQFYSEVSGIELVRLSDIVVNPTIELSGDGSDWM